MEPGINFLHSLFEVSHVEYQSYDLTAQQLLFSSGVASKLLGYSPAEYEGFSARYFAALVHPEDRRAVEETVGKVYAARDGEIVE